MTTNGKRNRTAGGNWERALAQLFRDIGFKDIITTRQGSRELDALKIDLMNSNTSKEGRFKYNIQAKCVKGHLLYGKVIGELPKEAGFTNVVCHRMTRKVGNRFIEEDTFAILYLDDFLELVRKLRDYESRTNIK